MNYIIYDLEFNQKHPDVIEIDGDTSSLLPFEIIQIGALKLNEKFETIDTFNSLVKPLVHTTIHPYVENLTKINKETLNLCKSFPDIYEDLIKFIGTEETILCVWGVVDVKELLRNIKFHNLSTSSISRNYIDIQQYASKYYNSPKGCRIGLRSTVEILNISINNEFHDAFNDAYYTAEVFKRLYNDSMKPKIYIPKSRKSDQHPKEKIDTVALIKQFEKMYDREMSEEEINMIKTAYMMGKTKQFVV